jgi:hypothetical protein
MITYTKEEITLYAALIAAVVSIFSLLINLFTQRRMEWRTAQRKSLEDFVHDLGEAIHSTIATSNILLKARTDESIQNWRERATEAKEELKKLRPKLRYPLWGITESINTLSRLPDWVEHARKCPDYAQDIFEKGHSLGKSLDRVIRKCYLRGRSPRLCERLFIRFRQWQLENSYEKFQKRDRPNQTTPAA